MEMTFQWIISIVVLEVYFSQTLFRYGLRIFLACGQSAIHYLSNEFVKIWLYIYINICELYGLGVLRYTGPRFNVNSVLSGTEITIIKIWRLHDFIIFITLFW